MLMSAQETIKRIRKHLLLDQDEFASLIGITKQAVSNYERGIRNPSLKNIRKMKELAEKNDIPVKVEDFLD